MGAKNILEFGVETFKRATGMRAWEEGIVASPRTVPQRFVAASAELLFPTTTDYRRLHGDSSNDYAISDTALIDLLTIAESALFCVGGSPELGIMSKVVMNAVLPRFLNRR